MDLLCLLLLEEFRKVLCLQPWVTWPQREACKGKICSLQDKKFEEDWICSAVCIQRGLLHHGFSHGFLYQNSIIEILVRIFITTCMNFQNLLNLNSSGATRMILVALRKDQAIRDMKIRKSFKKRSLFHPTKEISHNNSWGVLNVEIGVPQDFTYASLYFGKTTGRIQRLLHSFKCMLVISSNKNNNFQETCSWGWKRRL